MIDWLIPARLRRLLAALVLHPEKDYSFNELIRVADVGNRGGQMAIQSLVNDCVITESRVGNQRRFRVNTAYPLYGELRAICLKTFGVADPIREALGKFDGIEEVFVFGSVARGDDRADSDIDVMAIGEADPFKWNDCACALEQQLGRPVHFSLYEREEWQRLVATDPVIQAINDGPKLMVIENDRTSGRTGTPA
jgi:predicted nucleotidyltransferase